MFTPDQIRQAELSFVEREVEVIKRSGPGADDVDAMENAYWGWLRRAEQELEAAKGKAARAEALYRVEAVRRACTLYHVLINSCVEPVNQAVAAQVEREYGKAGADLAAKIRERED